MSLEQSINMLKEALTDNGRQIKEARKTPKKLENQRARLKTALTAVRRGQPRAKKKVVVGQTTPPAMSAAS